MGIANITLETRALIDAQLLIMAQINARMGKDTKADEKIECRRQIANCLKEIKSLDREFYQEICPDEKDKI